jgi:hypothetical protein
VLDTVIDSVSGSMETGIESVLASVPNPVPTAGQLRIARSRAAHWLTHISNPARRPLLAGLGTLQITTELIIERLRELLFRTCDLLTTQALAGCSAASSPRTHGQPRV